MMHRVLAILALLGLTSCGPKTPPAPEVVNLIAFVRRLSRARISREASTRTYQKVPRRLTEGS